MTYAGRMAWFEHSDLYVVITEAFCAGRDGLDVLDQVLAAGVTLVQLREKVMTTLATFRERTRAAGAWVRIDDRVDLALWGDADGVHLGEHDLPIAAARAIAPELILGASAHNLDEALQAQDAGASYVNIGPIFGTRTKQLPMAPLGPEALDTIAPRLHIPWTTMGGIKAHNIHEVVTRGATHIAVVTAVTAAKDVRSAAMELRVLMRRATV